MSRAFVRESDGDGPDDLPELPLSPHPNYVTPRGLAQLQSRLSAALARLSLLDATVVGAALERAHINREIRWLQQRIATALLIRPEAQAAGRAGIGACIQMEDDAGQTYRYVLVGEDEADPEKGLLSWVSPLGRALKGAAVGDSVTWPRPAGDLVVEILGVDYGPY